jgi:DNA polymerase
MTPDNDACVSPQPEPTLADRERFYRLVDDISGQLRMVAESGCPGFDPPLRVLDILDKWERRPGPGGRKKTVIETLDDIRREMGECRRCNLCHGRSRIVFGEGSPDARLVFVGEGPGFEEDRQGAPFVGEAGRLLTKIIQAMGETRGSVYICNVVKCRPPKNRNPQPDEIAACLPFLKRQIAAIRPAFICALGGVAAQTLLETDGRISELRGRFHDLVGVRVMPTFHPAFLLRNPERKRDVWEDMKKVMGAMAQKTD